MPLFRHANWHMTNASQDFSDRSKMKPNVFAFLNIVLGEAQDIKRTQELNTAFTDVINIHADGGVTAGQACCSYTTFITSICCLDNHQCF